MTTRFVELSAWVVIAGASGCGVSVGQPIGIGVGPVNEAGTDTPGAKTDAPADAPTDPLVDGLVAYWRLDEKRATDVVIDSAERGNSGISVNAPDPSTSLPPVKFTDIMSRTFNGSTQYVAVGNSDVLNFEGAITLAAWVKVNAFPDGCGVILGHGFRQDLMQEVTMRIGTGTCGGSDTAPVWAVGAWDGINHFAMAPLLGLDVATWIHLAGVYDGSAWHLYRNGEEIAKQPTTVGAILVDADWAIGARGPSVPPGAARFFNGSIDDVRIYRRSFSATEVLALYHH